MKAVFVAYNQALSEQVERVIANTGVRGFTKWQNVMGTGTHNGEPHLGTHTWPAMNSSMLIITDPETACALMERLHLLNEETPRQGLRAFMWNIEQEI